ncbi:NUDIX hydrolase [Millisia brevis]|uniref:NUDIX hydrolase n=1 Tax=Millisia brevis TaxID=264148 RepID=UPI00083673F3|nr:NUDIX domain-containing protein [Millisia brevis]
MPIPDFIVDLRAHIGTAELWLSGVSAVVIDHDGRILLARRADNNLWAVISGILEPGEEPATAVVREVAEETGLTVRVDRLTSVDVTATNIYPNGDRTRFLDLCFLAHPLGSTDARVNDDENLEVRWFSPDDLPADMTETSVLRIEKALAGDERAWFRT